MKPDHDRIKHLLTQSVTSLCKSVLQYRKKIQGRLEITVDDDERFVVHINEVAGGNPSSSHINGAMRHDQQLRQPPGLGPSGGFGDDSYGSLAQNNFLLPFSFGSGAGSNNNPHYAALNLTSADYPTIGFWPQQEHPPHTGLPQSSCQMSGQVDRTYHVHVHVNSSSYMDNQQQPSMNQFSDLMPNDNNVGDGGNQQQQQHGGAAASAAQKIVNRSKKTFGKTFGSSMTGAVGKKKPRSKSKGGTGCQCKICGKVLAYSNHMAAHMRTHTGEKPYVCTVCNKAFNRTFNLQEHMRVHTGERPYPCTMCDKTFKLANALAKHVLVHSDERPFVCSVCNKAYKQACELKHHLLIHTGEKPYVCDQCGKSFRWAHCLTRHKAEVVHAPREDAGEGGSGGASGSKGANEPRSTPSGHHHGRGGGTHPDKIFTCTVCNKTFMQTSRLITHMLSHTDHRPHLCTVCGKSFKYLNNLVEHMKTKRHTSEMAAAAEGTSTTLIAEEVNSSASNGPGEVGDINPTAASDLGEVNLSVSAALEVAVGD